LTPSYTELDPDPLVKPPPWIQNSTGRFAPSFSPRVQTLSTRQSSLGVIARRETLASSAGPAVTCGAIGPYSNMSRTPVQGAGFDAGRNRIVPPVAPPYGMPLNT
jgi:hypothetical protein